MKLRDIQWVTLAYAWQHFKENFKRMVKKWYLNNVRSSVLHVSARKTKLYFSLSELKSSHIVGIISIFKGKIIQDRE